LKFQKIGPFFSQKSTYFSAFSALKNENKKIKNHPPTKEFDCASAVIITSN
jgi:hypothetical protein